MICPQGHTDIVLVEYSWGDPFHYDGVSEIVCRTCNKRYGRWTKKILKDGESEKPYGDDTMR